MPSMPSPAQKFAPLLFAVFCVPALAQTSPPEYTIRGEPHTPIGSALRPTLASGGNLPFNKTYDELTVEEKETLNKCYESMGPGDEPPFPARGLKPFYTAVIKVQQKLGVWGMLTLVATVNPEGNVTQVTAIGDFDPEATKVIATILTLTKFKPALCKGVPCQMDYPFRIHFK
jgi:hypothetical protein